MRNVYRYHIAIFITRKFLKARTLYRSSLDSHRRGSVDGRIWVIENSLKIIGVGHRGGGGGRLEENVL